MRGNIILCCAVLFGLVFAKLLLCRAHVDAQHAALLLRSMYLNRLGATPLQLWCSMASPRPRCCGAAARPSTFCCARAGLAAHAAAPAAASPTRPCAVAPPAAASPRARCKEGGGWVLCDTLLYCLALGNKVACSVLLFNPLAALLMFMWDRQRRTRCANSRSPVSSQRTPWAGLSSARPRTSVVVAAAPRLRRTSPALERVSATGVLL